MTMARPPKRFEPKPLQPLEPPQQAFRIRHSSTALLVWRAVYCAALFVWLVNRARLDFELERRWEALRTCWWFKHDSFEPLLATLAFGFWINVWRIADLRCPVLHRWRIDPEPVKPLGQSPLEFLLRPGIVNLAAVGYLAPLLIFDQLYPRRVLPARCPRCAQPVTPLPARAAFSPFMATSLSLVSAD
jgi:hypothetical protein